MHVHVLHSGHFFSLKGMSTLYLRLISSETKLVGQLSDSQRLNVNTGGGGGGYSDMFFNFNKFRGFQKNEYFGGMKILWIFLLGHHKIGIYLGIISMHFRVFSKGKGTEWVILFWVANISNIFGVLEIPDVLGVNGRCWARAYV